ncbi:MAG TPA: hypothetical protein VF121_03015 [Thermoanaerobaculia bacterium]|nr:hypothetical protein [Thermoanaerobaculia bacterium]
MSEGQQAIAWSLFAELRKELVESQRIRTQVIGFKITFVSAAVGVIATNLDKIPLPLLMLPAFAAVFFDFLINSYSFSIKRIGHYCREHLEPAVRKELGVPDDLVLWEEYLLAPYARQRFAFLGNLGFTALVSAIGVMAAVNPFRLAVSVPLVLILIVLLGFDLYAYLAPDRFRHK